MGLVEVLNELKKIQDMSEKRGSWYSTHPPLSQRIQRAMVQLNKYQDRAWLAKLPGRFKEFKRIF